jgi:transposase
MRFPGIGPALATTLVASIPDSKAFPSGRNFSAWIGLVPKQSSSGGQEQAWQYQQARRSLSAQPLYRRRTCRHPLCQDPRHKASPWLTALLARRPTKVAAIALASKIARMAWAMMAKGECYKEPVALVA